MVLAATSARPTLVGRWFQLSKNGNDLMAHCVLRTENGELRVVGKQMVINLAFFSLSDLIRLLGRMGRCLLSI